jgi:hypothetical protein
MCAPADIGSRKSVLSGLMKSTNVTRQNASWMSTLRQYRLWMASFERRRFLAIRYDVCGSEIRARKPMPQFNNKRCPWRPLGAHSCRRSRSLSC